MINTIIEVDNINFSYTNNRNVLNNISLTLKQGEVISILGPNGAGKSTLLNCIATINNINSGEIKLCGQNIKQMSQKKIASIISYVPQNHIPVFPYKVFDFVLMGRAPKINMFEKPSIEDCNIVKKVLLELGISHLADKSYTEISGGERQQATIARALVQEPKVILFDEPTAHLDYGNQIKTLRIIKELSKKGYSIIITTHNPDHAIMLGGTTAILDKNGNLTVGDTNTIINENNLQKIYETDIKLIYVENIKRFICVPPII